MQDRGSASFAQPRRQVALEEFQEPPLVVPGGVEDQVVEAGAPVGVKMPKVIKVI